MVGVTQAYAASVLRSTSGTVFFMIGREKDIANSEIAHLISQSIQAERQREAEYSTLDQAPNKALPREPESNDNSLCEGPDDSISELVQSEESFSRQNGSNSYSVLNETINDLDILNKELKEWQRKYASVSDELSKVKEKADIKYRDSQMQLEDTQTRLQQSESALIATGKEVEKFHKILDDTKSQYTIIEKKYHKAKKLIKGFQQREIAFSQKDESNSNQILTNEEEYMTLVKTLKERIVVLEKRLEEAQKAAGLPIPSTSDICLREIFATFVANSRLKDKKRMTIVFQQILLDTPNENCPEYENVLALNTNTESSQELNIAQVELLDSSAAKQKAGLASQGSLANRQPPSIRRQSSCSSVEMASESDSPHRTANSSPSKRPLSEPNQLTNQPQVANEWPSHVSEDVGLPLSVNTASVNQIRPSTASSEQTLSSPSSYLSSSPNPNPFHCGQTAFQLMSPQSSSSSPSLSSPCSPERSFNGSNKSFMFCGVHVADWTQDDVAHWLQTFGLGSYVNEFKNRGISGQYLLQLDSSQLKVRFCY